MHINILGFELLSSFNVLTVDGALRQLLQLLFSIGFNLVSVRFKSV